MGSLLSSRVCVPLYVLDRNEGCSLNKAEVPWGSLVLSVQGLRDGVSLRGRVCESVYVLDRIVGFPEPLFSSTFAMRSPLWVESAYLCTYSIGTKVLTLLVLGFKFLRDGVTLLGRVSVPLYVLDRNEGFNLFFSAFLVLRDGVTLFRVEYPYSCVLDRIEGTPCCWLLRPCLA